MADVLRDKVAVITGSGRGIGRALALAMAKEGAGVVVNDCVPGSAEATTRDITDAAGQAVTFSGDISKFEVAQQLIQTAVDNFGRIDILVNNAGINILGMIWEMSEEDWDRTVDIHLKGTFNCTRHACRFMKEQRWGRIINTSSAHCLSAWNCCNYAAAKAGIIGLTRTVANDMKKYGVTCNAYCPLTTSEMAPRQQRDALWEEALKAGFITEEQARDLLIDVPNVETVAPAIIYLCTDEAANITGQVFNVRGGDIAIYSAPVKRKSIHKDYKEKGLWTIEELKDAIPKMLEG